MLILIKTDIKWSTIDEIKGAVEKNNMTEVLSTTNKNLDTINNNILVISENLKKVITEFDIGANDSVVWDSLPWGSDGNNAGGGQTSNRDLTFEKYKLQFPNEVIENGLIKIKDHSIADKADSIIGRRTDNDKTRFPKENFYRPTKASLEWAIKNNTPFGSTESDKTHVNLDNSVEANNTLSKGHAVRTLTVFPKVNTTPVEAISNSNG